MAWCEKCGGEYVDGITECTECDLELTYKSQTSKDLRRRRRQRIKELKEELEGYREVFLVNTNSLVEINYIISLLEEKNIGYRVAEESSGSYLTVLHGKSFFGKNIYVEQSSFDEAMWIIESYDADIEMEEELDIPKEQMISTKGKIFMGGFLIFVVVILILI